MYFGEILKHNNTARLLLVGDGEDFDKIKLLIKNKKIEDYVLLLGMRNDVPQLLSAMDVFLLPSHFEGLPIVLVEAQANGLPAIVSDHVTREVCYSNMIQYLPINEGTVAWSNLLLSGSLIRYAVPDEISQYEIKNASNALIEKYYTLLEGSSNEEPSY